MTARRLACLLLLAALLVPGASAFATRQDALTLSYESDASPVIVASGRLALTGVAAGGVAALGAEDLRLVGIPQLTVLERDGDAFRESTFRDATLRVLNGSLVWRFPEEGRLREVAWSADYAMALALPQGPIPAGDNGSRGAGFMVAGPDLQAAGVWSGAPTDLLLLDALVTIEDRNGRAEAGWEARRVNAGASFRSADASGMDTLFQASGAFRLAGTTAVLGGAAKDSSLELAVAPGPRDRFLESLDLLEQVGVELAGEAAGGAPLGAENPLRALAPFSGILNGAILVVAQGEDGEGGAQPVEARLGESEFDVGPMSLLRSHDLRVAWSQERLDIQGTPVLAISRAGVAVHEPTAVGPVPILSLVLWAAAAGALAYFVVRRPPKGVTSWTLRLSSAGVHVLVFLAVFWLWDASFHETFGTSAITQWREGGFADPARLATTLGIQMLPWGLAALAFALPVRIAVGVGLRYLGRGKSLKGVASAAGLVSLAVFGPLYAMWFMDFAVREVVSRIG